MLLSLVRLNGLNRMVGNVRGLASTAKIIQYQNHGDPLEVLSLREEVVELKEGNKSGVHFRMLASPINPADINQIQGVYPIKPPVPAVGGNEGVAEVLHVGSNVTSVKPGDWIIPSQAGFGTWRTEGVWDESQVQKITKEVPVEFAASIRVNPCTAYRMLLDFETLKEGDSVIQNGANGGVGKAVIQIAARRKIKTVNVVRKRENFNEVADELYRLGATLVVSDEDLVKVPFMRDVLAKKIGEQLPPLALNCVGGDNATNMSRYLRDGGTMVTYGGMSKKPLTLPTGSLIFRDHSFKGFWMTRWGQESPKDQQDEMMRELCDWAKAGLFKVDVVRVPLADFKVALGEATKPYKQGKQLLVM